MKGPSGARAISQEDSDPQHAFATDSGDFHQRAIAHAIRDREHSAIWELDVIDATAVFVERIANDDRLESQMRGEPVVVDCGQCGKQPVL